MALLRCWPGQAGSTFTAAVAGFVPGETVSFSYGTAAAGSCTAGTAGGATGGCQVTVTVPGGPAGSYTVTAAGGNSGLTATATFTQT
jgi:hypothetical protein